MLAIAGPLPAPRDEDRWAFEMKWDGVRAVVYPGTRMLPLAKNRLFLRFFVARALMR